MKKLFGKLVQNMIWLTREYTFETPGNRTTIEMIKAKHPFVKQIRIKFSDCKYEYLSGHECFYNYDFKAEMTPEENERHVNLQNKYDELSDKISELKRQRDEVFDENQDMLNLIIHRVRLRIENS